MQWFLDRISKSALPISFGIAERIKYPTDFAKLIAKKILVQGSNLEMIDCQLCDEGHECAVRDAEKQIFYVCENGGGRKTITNEELAIFEYNNDAFLRLLAVELGIKTLGDGSFPDEGTHHKQVLYSIGTLYHQKVSGEVLYLRTNDDAEIELYVAQVRTGAKIILSNTHKPQLAMPMENVFFVLLADILEKGDAWFDKEKFTASLEGIRRVQIVRQTGQIYLDGKLKYTPEKEGPHYWFLLYLWDAWEVPRSYEDIYQYVRGKMGKEVEDTAKNFCQKMKAQIKKENPSIEKIVKVSSRGYYMMTDPQT